MDDITCATKLRQNGNSVKGKTAGNFNMNRTLSASNVSAS